MKYVKIVLMFVILFALTSIAFANEAIVPNELRGSWSPISNPRYDCTDTFDFAEKGATDNVDFDWAVTSVTKTQNGFIMLGKAFYMDTNKPTKYNLNVTVINSKMIIIEGHHYKKCEVVSD